MVVERTDGWINDCRRFDRITKAPCTLAKT